MRLTAIVALVAAAGMAHVAAVPIRLIMLPTVNIEEASRHPGPIPIDNVRAWKAAGFDKDEINNIENFIHAVDVDGGAKPNGAGAVRVSPIDNARFGHSAWKAAGFDNDEINNIEQFIQTVDADGGRKDKVPVHVGHRRPGCAGGRRRGGRGGFHQKAVKISNAVRKALGLPLIETADHPRHHHMHHGPPGEGMHPHPHHGPQNIHVGSGFVTIANGEKVWHTEGPPPAHSLHELEQPHHNHPEGFHGHHRHQLYHGERNAFFGRLHASLMNLGPWEGRAVAFVLGCGIGVLLRLFWVLAIVSYRVIKFRRVQAHSYTMIEEEHDVDPVPSYPVDEKVAPVEESK